MPRPTELPQIRYGRLAKSGHSQVINIPRELAEALGWRIGSQLELWIAGECLVVGLAVSRRQALEAIEAVAAAGGTGQKAKR